MKVCPVCNETFADELKFCDLDGTRLKREVGTQSPEKQNKAWSLIGVGLLVGALVLSALSITFLPKARVAPTVVSSETGQAVASRLDPAQTEVAQAGSADSQTPEIVAEEIPPAEVKKKDAAQNNANGNVNSTTPDPKAAAKEAGEDEQPAAQIEPPPVAPPPPPKEVDPAPVVKPASDTRDADAKPAANGDPKKDGKQSKDKDDDDKKSDKKDDKKKKKGGGLFGAFKKIFGKD
ncbi:MAG TPA: hypothetical protein VKA70_17230 [Blastocatellia bacterium]|nr:hypothetical protein [Blastocatellia bacterium]